MTKQKAHKHALQFSKQILNSENFFAESMEDIRIHCPAKKFILEALFFELETKKELEYFNPSQFSEFRSSYESFQVKLCLLSQNEASQ